MVLEALDADHAADLKVSDRTAGTFRRRTPKRQNRWMVRMSNGDAALLGEVLAPTSILVADAAVITEQAQAGDTVLISGTDVPSIVQTSDRLLNRGVSVALDARALPSIKPLVTRREHGTEWVDLRSSREGRLPLTSMRAVDVVAGLLASIVSAPVLAVLMVWIRATSPGHAIFRSPRVGRDGKPFDLFKLRTMWNAERSDHAARKEQYRDFMNVRTPSAETKLKVVDESRVTPAGRFLRKHSLDELPQFWNVVRGELSFVGPRPCLPYEWDLHDGWHRLRFRSRPGLTGFWQAYGRSQVTFEEMVLMDFCYGWRKSLPLDLKICLRTAMVVVTGEGGA